MVRDVRVRIADLVWEGQAAWSERGASSVTAAEREARWLVNAQKKKKNEKKEREKNKRKSEDEEESD